MNQAMILEGRGLRRLDLSSRTHLMGVLNITPDSFSDGGRFFDTDAAVAHARRMAEEGADIIDVGGESTRPGSQSVPADEELRRVIPVITRLTDTLDLPISIDTRKAEVARQAIRAGARILNDVSGLRADPDMCAVAADTGAPVVLMHSKGSPEDMQRNPYYDDTIREIKMWMSDRIEALCRGGVDRNRIILDPGIGFGKRISDNLLIIRSLSAFQTFGCPILIGPSRKWFIGQILDVPEGERVEGTAATVALAIANGAHIVRVHDVLPMVRVARMTDAIIRAEANERISE